MVFHFLSVIIPNICKLLMGCYTHFFLVIMNNYAIEPVGCHMIVLLLLLLLLFFLIHTKSENVILPMKSW